MKTNKGCMIELAPEGASELANQLKGAGTYEVSELTDLNGESKQEDNSTSAKKSLFCSSQSVKLTSRFFLDQVAS
jgi:hypothetical protein